jgi:hypothetical protein
VTVQARRPPIFIGSSAERFDVAYAVQESLGYDAGPAVRTRDVFKPGNYALIASC